MSNPLAAIDDPSLEDLAALLGELLAGEPGVGVWLIDDDDRICVYTNQAAVELYLGQEYRPEDVIGAQMTDIGEEIDGVVEDQYAVVRERMEPVYFRQVWGGRQILTAVTPVRGGNGKLYLLGTSRLVSGRLSSLVGDETIVDWNVVHLGPLDVLTQRELEVLACIGEGMITKEIAARLGCSPRTIEVHRQHIGVKLNESDRVRLAKIAFEAGITQLDVQRERVPQFTPFAGRSTD